MRVCKRVDKEPIWLSSLATWLRSLADMEVEVKAMREELDERNRLQIAMLNEFKRKQEEEIAAYLKVPPHPHLPGSCHHIISSLPLPSPP